jgi:LCP family protein required for cell wall assembly
VEDVGTGRSDGMMIVHTEPELGTAFVVSFPRDTEVAIDGHGHDKLNAAFAYGGPALTIKTFRDDFGIPIQHFLAVNFVGFQKIVDAIGHVKIFFPTPARDVFTGLYQPTRGCVALDGVQALLYARSRHYLIPRDGVTNPDPNNTHDWVEDPRSDLDRILRQQYFLRSLGQTALNRSVGNPLTAFALADAVTNAMTKDQTLTNGELKQLVRTFRGLNPATVEMTTIPIQGGTNGAPLTVEYPEAQPVLDRLKNLTPPPFVLPQAAKPSTVMVVVVDGSGVKGRAAQVEDELVARGFVTGGSADASISDFATTQVRYGTGQGKKGLSVSEYIGSGNAVEVASTDIQEAGRTLKGDVLVILGRDFPNLHGLLTKSLPSTSAGSTAALGSTVPASSASSTTTTTSGITPDTRYVPVSGDSINPLVGCPKT